MVRDEIEKLVIRYMASEIKLGPGRDKKIFAKRSFAKYACQMIYSELRSNPNTPALDIIERFAKRMDVYSCQKAESSWMFSIMYDTAIDILDSIDVYERTKIL